MKKFTKRRVWLECCPGVALRGVVIGKGFFRSKVLVRDFDGKCRIFGACAFELLNRERN